MLLLIPPPSPHPARCHTLRLHHTACWSNQGAWSDPQLAPHSFIGSGLEVVLSPEARGKGHRRDSKQTLQLPPDIVQVSPLV